MRNFAISQKFRLVGSSALSGLVVSLGFLPACAQAQESPSEQASSEARDISGKEDIIVTASRRTTDVTKVPYNIAVVGGAQLESTGVSSVEDLSRQVPNLVVTSSGGNLLGAQRQIMRGLNASASGRRGLAFEQDSVSTYLDNSPYGNFFPVKDIARVEVLRGPQGTLYGAGSLGGAIRLITNEPALGKFEGSMQASIGLVDHSKDQDYSFQGVINIPIGNTLALRASASHSYNAGFIDQYGSFVREGGGPIGSPVLADPFDVANSAPVTETIRDINWDRTTYGRASLKWEPADEFKAVAAYNYVRSKGFGPNSDTPRYDGGPDPFSPSLIYPDTGKYEALQRGIEPFDRKSEMWSLDLSYDAGFATVSSSSSYFKTRGDAYYDATLGTAALPAAYVAYYVGSPANPRFNAIHNYADKNRVFTQELRLVSNGGGAFDYTFGLFYQREKRGDFWTGYYPGQYVYNQAPGVTNLSGVGPDDFGFNVSGTQKFTDKAIFGEVTWRPTDRIAITAGGRLFEQKIDRVAVSELHTFLLFETSANKVKFSDHTLKLNASYEFQPGHQFYATFSQGFRRGGANAFALTGLLQEPAEILDYVPDSVDNYEIGVKGRFANGWRYTLDGFIDNWHNPQIGGSTPVNVWPITVNGKEAKSKGIEFELSGDLSSELAFSVAYSYTEAKLTEDFCVPVGAGDGVNFIPCGFIGTSGTTLPSAPKHSGSMTLNYRKELGPKDSVGVDFNLNYKGSMRQNLPQDPARQRYPLLPDYFAANLNLSWDHGPWTTSAYVRNLFDARQVQNNYTRITPFEPLDLADIIGRPRQFGIALRYSW